jgi:hypothetical protein
MLLALCKAVGVVAPMYTWEQWQLRCKLHKLLFWEAARGAGGPSTALDEVLVGCVHDGCIANLVRGGCNPAAAAAIVANLGQVVANATAELAVGGKGGRGTTTRGGEEASKDGSPSLLVLMLMATAAELKVVGSRVEDGCQQRQTATHLLLLGGEGGRECSHQGVGNIKITLT